jgi:predicted dehydrogenase
MERKVKVGFVGCGFMQQLAHLPNFASSAKCELVALAEPREKLRKLIADKFGIKRQYSTHMDLLEDPEVEAVVAILPDQLHAPVSIDCMKAGKHVMIEKPMATRLEDAIEMNAVAKATGMKLMVAFTRRYDEAAAKAKAVIESGEIGKPLWAHTYYFGGDWTCGLDKEAIRTDERAPEADELALFPTWLPESLWGQYRFLNNNLVHNYNMLRYLFGNEFKVEHVQMKDSIMITMSFGGICVSLEGGFGLHRGWKEGLELFSYDGCMNMIFPAPLLRNVPGQLSYSIVKERHETISPTCAWEWAFKRQAEHFLDCIIEDKQPASNGADSVADMEILDAIFRMQCGK